MNLLIGIPVSTNATNLSYTFGGGNLTLSWPADHTGWRLETQTNSRAIGLSTNWFTVSDSAATNQITISLNATNGSVFFRLVHP